jgi:serine/threonine protein kinase
VHRDVKPENVMVCTRGGVKDFVKVLDFGLVKDVAAPEPTKIATETSIAGTPVYLLRVLLLLEHRLGFPSCGRPGALRKSASSFQRSRADLSSYRNDPSHQSAMAASDARFARAPRSASVPNHLLWRAT